MADMNWIKLNRKIWDSFIWSFEDPKYTLAWIDMLLMANYKDKQIRCRGTVETIRRGSFVTSILKLAERWGMNRKTVKNFLDVLQQNGMITYTTSNRWTTVSISNYLLYQGFPGFESSEDGQQNGQQNGQQSGQQNGHNIRKKESKECKKEESEENAPVPYEEIKNMFCAICKSYPRCTVMSEARRKAVKARFASGYTLDDFKTLFAKAEASSFLRGQNDRNWSANFDWLIKDANMAKVLDGNYDDKERRTDNGPGAGNHEPPQRIGKYI